MRRLALPALAVAVVGLIAAGVVGVVTRSSNAATRVLVGTAVGGKPTSSNPSDPNYVLAQAEALKLLALAPLPPGAQVRSGPPPAALAGPSAGVPDTNHFLDRYRLWTVAMTPGQSMTWLSAHRPPGLAPGGQSDVSDQEGQTSGVFWSAPETGAYDESQLSVSVTSAGSGSIWRADGSDIWISATPAPYTHAGPTIHVTITAGCPSSLTGYDDVSNSPSLTTRLLPPGLPTAGLICRYGGLNQPEPPSALARSIHLDPAQAQRLARIIAGAGTGSTGDGVTNCPADFGGTDIIVFAYPGRPDADLWYHTSGCLGLDNGAIAAGAGGNPAFFTEFESTVSALAGS